MSYAAALFDMDGLLIDSEQSLMRAWLEATGEEGIALTAHDYMAVVGCVAADSDAILETICGGRPCFERVRGVVEQRLCGGNGAAIPLKPGVAQLLAALAARGVPCAVASSSTRAEIEQRLAAVGVLHHFAAIAAGDEVVRGKPEPDIFVLAAQRLGVRAAECLVFEDSHNGARAALAAGAGLVLVPDLLAPTDELAARSLCVLQSLAEAGARLDRWFAPARRARVSELARGER